MALSCSRAVRRRCWFLYLPAAAGNFRGRMPCGRRMPLMFKQSDNNEQLSSPDVTAHGPLI
jgi:hypothetical protein